MKELPIGMQSFSELITSDYLYVDKTRNIYDLIKPRKGYYFLSRPRRFGKSLLISTLEAIFKAQRDLFKGLWIAQSDYEWPEHPVIRIDFANTPGPDAETLSRSLNKRITEIAREYDLTVETDSNVAVYLNSLIRALFDKYRSRVVILIDEYDSPIISNIRYPEVWQANRDVLASFYRTIKSNDEFLRFVFLAGVSKFAKVSVFSGLNNLLDITLDQEFATLLGYTKEEIEEYFSENIDLATKELGTDRVTLLNDIKQWYNGYRFTKKDARVYNPFSVLLFFKNAEFQNYWFETGTPSFLLDLIRANDYDLRSIHDEVLSSRDFNSYEVDSIPLLPILFNTGYLTISQVEQPDMTQTDYKLNYPNNEVRISFLEQFIDSAFSKGTAGRNYARKLEKSIRSENLEEVFTILKTFFSGLPYDLKRVNCDTESYYQSLVFSIFKLVGYDTSAEERTNKGRIDLVTEGSKSIYIFEMKVDKPAHEAIEQIKQRGYAEKYRLRGKKLVLVGLSFSSKERNISEYQIEEI